MLIQSEGTAGAQHIFIEPKNTHDAKKQTRAEGLYINYTHESNGMVTLEPLPLRTV